MKRHAISNIFTMLPDAELRALAQDILSNGQKEPIILFEGKILDGRNRYEACQLIGVEPKFIEFEGTKKDAISLVWSTNFHRRHLTSSQAAMALAERKKIDPSFVEGVVEPLVEEAKEAKAEGQKSGGRGKKNLRKKVSGSNERPRTKLAKMHGTNATTVAKCEKILVEHPELVEDIKAGKMSVTQAMREVTKTTIAKTVDWPEGKYRIIYADPPWSYGNTQPDYHTEQRDHYPVMPLKDICQLPVVDLAMDNAVLFLWVTSPVLEESFQVIKAWGFKYKSSFVWDKVGHNMGHYNSVRHEFLLVCVRGSCQPDVAKLYDSVFTFEREGHSKKPEFFYEVIDTIYPHGPRIELFARNKRKGWNRYGHQA